MTQAFLELLPPTAAPTITPAATLVMGGMVRCDQMGMYDGLGHLLRVHKHAFPAPKSGSDDGVGEFATFSHLRSRYFEARDLESRYGKGALLNLEHQDVATLIRNRQVLTEREVEAAKAFRETKAKFYADWRADAAIMPSASGKGPAIWVPLGS